MHKLIFTAAAMLIVTWLPNVHASLSDIQGVDRLALWPAAVPGQSQAKHPPVQSADTSRGVTRFTDVTDPDLLVFNLPADSQQRPAVIVAPGGGYDHLAVDIEGVEIARWLNQQGVSAFVLEYRVPKQAKQALFDMQRAIKMVRSHASQWHLNPNNIGLMGFSAGGHLSAMASSYYNQQTYTPMDEIDSVSAQPNFALLIYPAYLAGSAGDSLSAGLTVNQHTPPMFLFGTADDHYSNHSVLAMANALTDAKVPFELHVLAKGGHGYGLRAGNAAAQTWPGLTHKWLKANVLNH